MTVETTRTRTQDYLESPPHLERQLTQNDINWQSNQEILACLKDIRRELFKQNPDVLTTVIVQGGPVISDLLPRTVRFEVGNKPVTVYKTYIWTQTAKPIRVSVNGMSTAQDGFSLSSQPILLEVPVYELSVQINAGPATVGINVPYSSVTDGSIFIYAFTISDYLSQQNYGASY